MRRGLPIFVFCLVASVTVPSFAQSLSPGTERPALPEPEGAPGEATGPDLNLPDIDTLVPDTANVASGLSVHVERYEVRGSTVFTPDELTRALAPYAGRTITTEELLAARDAITQLYVDAGYVTSGATLPDQDVTGGIVLFDVVEGALGEVRVSGNQRFRSLYLKQRIQDATQAPLQMNRLENVLKQLQRDPWIERVDATLQPGSRPGLAQLELRVEETLPFRLRFETANDRSPAVGSIGASGTATAANALGFRDVHSVRVQWTEGLRDVDVRSEVPVTPWDTRLRLRYRDTKTEIVEEPFDDLDIEATTRSYMIGLRHPVYRWENDEIWLGLLGEHRRTKSEVLGEAFCFEPQTASCDDPTVTALRLEADWTRRLQQDVFSFRSLFSLGVDLLDATVASGSNQADGRFFAWLGQAQWAHVLPESYRGSQVLLRGDAQLASDALLSIEKFSAGGGRSVRGYRENQRVRDNGVTLGGEIRIPLWRDSLRRSYVELVPFTDFAHVWNDGDERGEDTLWSVGAGLRITPTEWIEAEIYWGGQLLNIRNPGEELQDEGVHFRLAIDAF